MATCTFVRKNSSGYEYGVVQVNDSGSKHETRVYNVRGKADTIDQALAENAMALKGQPGTGKVYVNLNGW